MIQKIIYRLLRKRHFWREIGFDELSEIYASQFLRSLALNIISVFVPIYLYKIGYSISSILLLFLVWFGVRPLYCLLAAKLIARIGPKHVIALANVIYIVFLTLLISIEDLNWPLALIALVGSLATTLFLIAFQVDFSKIKHSEHGGKELSYEHIVERIGAVLGPIVGGLVATFIDPRYAFATAIIVLCASLVPIFMSAEPIHTRQQIVYKGFPWRRHKRDFVSGVGFDVENLVTGLVWPLFIAITVLTANTYATLGLLAAVSTAIALIAIFTIGRLVDEKRGGMLLRAGAVTNAILHLCRPFASSFGLIIAVNVINEPLTVAYRLPYEKGRYDACDSAVGYRIVYFTLTNIIGALGDTLFLLLAWCLSMLISPVSTLKYCFVIGALASLLITSQRFIALRDN